MKISSLILLSAVVLVTLTTASIADPGPTCGPSGCQKPGLRQVIVFDGPNDPAPTCGPSGCQKPGLLTAEFSSITGPDDPGPTCGPSGCQKPGAALLRKR